MTQFHPDARFLTDYAAGTLSMAQAVAVSVHLEYCPHCRQRMRSLVEVGAAVFDLKTEEVSSTLTSEEAEIGFDAILAKLEQPEATVQAEVESIESISQSKLVDKLIAIKKDQFKWKKVTNKLAFSRLATGDSDKEVGLYHIFAGGKIPEHRHHGEEITVVIKGSFSDADGKYSEGDFLLRSGDERHSPMAPQNEDCICLTVVDAPVRFTKGLARLVNPFLSIHPQ